LFKKVNKVKPPSDGISWLIDYVCRLAKTYPSFSLDFVWDELPMAQGWAYYAWSIEADGWLNFSGIKRASAGYLKQESDKLIEQAHKAWQEV